MPAFAALNSIQLLLPRSRYLCWPQQQIALCSAACRGVIGGWCGPGCALYMHACVLTYIYLTFVVLALSHLFAIVLITVCVMWGWLQVSQGCIVGGGGLCTLVHTATAAHPVCVTAQSQATSTHTVAIAPPTRMFVSVQKLSQVWEYLFCGGYVCDGGGCIGLRGGTT